MINVENVFYIKWELELETFYTCLYLLIDNKKNSYLKFKILSLIRLVYLKNMDKIFA